MKKLIEEFKAFAMRGNVVDLAVGVVIGGAFGKIVSSLVSDVLMPPLGVLLGGVDFTALKITIQKAVVENGVMREAVTINYGSFIQAVVDFVIIAFSIFMIIKLMNAAKKAEEEKSEQIEPSKEQVLLAEIRDLLREKKS